MSNEMEIVKKEFEALVLASDVLGMANYVGQRVKNIKKLIKAMDRKRAWTFVSAEKSDIRWIVEKVEQRQNADYYVGYYSAYLEAMQFQLDLEMQQEKAQEIVLEYSDSIRHFDAILQCIQDAGHMRHSHLAQSIGIKCNTLTDIMDKVCQTGLVSFTRSGRLKHYYLTDAGKRYQINRKTWHKQINPRAMERTVQCYNNVYGVEHTRLLNRKGNAFSTNSIPDRSMGSCSYIASMESIIPRQNDNRRQMCEVRV